MSGFPDYDNYDALGLAELVRTRQVTPAELLEEAIARADRLNPALNAIIYRMDEPARATAARRSSSSRRSPSAAPSSATARTTSSRTNARTRTSPW